MTENPKTKRPGGAGMLYLRGKTWWTQVSVRGRTIRESTQTSDEKKAAKILRKRAGAIANEIIPDDRSLRYCDLRRSFFDDYRTNKRRSLRYAKDGTPYLDKVNRLDSFFEGYRASEISTDDVRKFILDQQGKGLANGSVNRSLAALKRMLRLAVQDGRLRAAPYIPMLREAAPRSGFFEPAEYEALYRTLPDYLRLVLGIAFFTGMRRAEVCGLRWEQVNFLDDSIRLNPGETKSGEGRTIPVVPQLRTLLVEQRAKRHPGCPYVCFRPNRKGHLVKIGNFRKVWQARCVKLGLGKMEPSTNRTTGEPLFVKPRGPRSKPKVKMIYQGKLFHDLRRSAVRFLVRSGNSEKVAMKISGHSTRSVFDRYNIVSEDDLAEAGRKLGEFHVRHNSDTISTPDIPSNDVIN